MSKSPYAPSLTDEQFAALPQDDRVALVAAYYADTQKVHEDKPYANRSDTLDVWAKDLGYPVGLPWCGIYAATVLRLAGYTGAVAPGPAGTHNWASWAKGKGYSVGDTPKRGDLFVQLHTSTTGHMGVCLGPDTEKAHYTRTCEGNTNETGGREGYMVARKSRLLVANAKTVIVRLPEPKAVAKEDAPDKIEALVHGEAVDGLLIQDGGAPASYIALRPLIDSKIVSVPKMAPGVAFVASSGSRAVAQPIPLLIVDGKGYVPARMLAQVMFGKLNWDNKAKRVTIT